MQEDSLFLDAVKLGQWSSKKQHWPADQDDTHNWCSTGIVNY